MSDIAVIGAGPAGLMAAEVLARAGHRVTIYEAKPSPARKFLMAGKSGLNFTRDEPPAQFAANYDAPWLAPILSAFGPPEVMAWARGLGIELFTGSTGRVFPVEMKGSPLLRAWLRRLDGLGVQLQRRWRWTGWQGAALRVEVAPFRPANMGFTVAWSAHMAPHFGAPVKGAALMAGGRVSRGEFVVSAHGIEGGGVYALSALVRDGAALTLDLTPDRSLAEVAGRLARPRGADTVANWLRKALHLDPLKLALLQEWGRPLPAAPEKLARLIKSLPVHHQGPRPIAEAISSAGGITAASLSEGFELRALPGTYAVGEMLDWEAPTGGYLITACLATARHAALAAATRLR